MIREARRRGIPTVAVVDYALHADRLFAGTSDDPLASAPDWVAVTDAWSASRFATLGHPRDRIEVVGHPLHDRLVEVSAELGDRDRANERRRLFPGAGVDELVVVFLAETDGGLHPERYRRDVSYTLSGRGGNDRRTHIVLEELLDALRRLDLAHHLVLRLHPKNRPAEFAAYRSEVDQVSTSEPAHEIVAFADLTVGMTTSLLEEATLIGARTLALLPRPTERDWLPTLRSGATRSVTSRQELDATLGELLMTTATLSPPAAPTGASARVVALVSRILHERR